MKRWIVLLLLLLSLVSRAEVFHKDLGLLPFDVKTTVNLYELFPELEGSYIDNLTSTVAANSAKDPNAFPEFVNVAEGIVSMMPTLDAPPGFYSLVFAASGQTQAVIVLSFQIDQVLKINADPQSFFLDGYRNSESTIEFQVTSNANWELYVQSLGSYPALEVTANGRTVYPNEVPVLLATRSGGRHTQSFNVQIKLAADYKDIPADFYVFPLVFTLSTTD